jgi:predicted dehydrogenase
MALDRLRIGVVGAGPVAEKYHLGAIRGVPEVFAEYVVDVDGQRAEKFATRNGFRRFGASHREMIGAVDIAIVALPNHLHAPVSIDLLSQGIHVLCEKPMARTPAECQTMVDAASRSGALLAIGHNRRFRDHLRLAKNLYDRGYIGEITEIQAEEGSVADWQRSAAYFDPQRSGGGSLMDVGIHAIDLIRWIAGEFQEVQYTGDQTPTVVESEAEMTFRMENGATGKVIASRTRELAQRLLLRGTQGFIEAGLWSDMLRVRSEKGKASRHFRHLEAYVSRRPPADSSFVDQLLNLVRAIRGQEPLLVDGRAGMEAVDVVWRAYGHKPAVVTAQSAATGGHFMSVLTREKL